MPSLQPQWQSQLASLLADHAHLPHSTFVPAASVRRDGRPANRVLSFRFFLPDGQLVFTTDARSEKTAELHANPWVELCWYFTEKRVQMRLLGTAVIGTGQGTAMLEQARQRSWRERSEQSRQSFSWPAPGQARGADVLFSLPCPETPPENFVLLVFVPERVDTLDLSSQPHRRELHVLEDGKWTATSINP